MDSLLLAGGSGPPPAPRQRQHSVDMVSPAAATTTPTGDASSPLGGRLAMPASVVGVPASSYPEASYIMQGIATMSRLRAVTADVAGWKSVITTHDRSGATVYRRTRLPRSSASDADLSTPMFMGVATVKKATPKDVMDVLQRARDRWDDWWLEGKIVARIDPQTTVNYIVLKGVSTAIASHRDLCLLERSEVDAETGIIRTAASSVDFSPSVPRSVSGRVRADLKLHGWIMEPQVDPNGRVYATRVSYIVQSDVKGLVTKALAQRYVARRALSVVTGVADVCTQMLQRSPGSIDIERSRISMDDVSVRRTTSDNSANTDYFFHNPSASTSVASLQNQHGGSPPQVLRTHMNYNAMQRSPPASPGASLHSNQSGYFPPGGVASSNMVGGVGSPSRPTEVRELGGLPRAAHGGGITLPRDLRAFLDFQKSFNEVQFDGPAPNRGDFDFVEDQSGYESDPQEADQDDERRMSERRSSLPINRSQTVHTSTFPSPPQQYQRKNSVDDVIVHQTNAPRAPPRVHSLGLDNYARPSGISSTSPLGPLVENSILENNDQLVVAGMQSNTLRSEERIESSNSTVPRPEFVAPSPPRSPPPMVVATTHPNTPSAPPALPVFSAADEVAAGRTETDVEGEMTLAPTPASTATGLNNINDDKVFVGESDIAIPLLPVVVSGTLNPAVQKPGVEFPAPSRQHSSPPLHSQPLVAPSSPTQQKLSTIKTPPYTPHAHTPSGIKALKLLKALQSPASSAMWMPESTTQNIEISTIPPSESNNNTLTIRGSTVFPPQWTAENIIATIKSNGARRIWDRRFRGSDILSWLNSNEFLFVAKFGGGELSQLKREIVGLHVTIHDPATFTTYIISTSVDTDIVTCDPDAARYVVPLAGWVVVPTEEGVRVTYVVRFGSDDTTPAALTRMQSFAIVMQVASLRDYLECWGVPKSVKIRDSAGVKVGVVVEEFEPSTGDLCVRLWASATQDGGAGEVALVEVFGGDLAVASVEIAGAGAAIASIVGGDSGLSGRVRVLVSGEEILKRGGRVDDLQLLVRAKSLDALERSSPLKVEPKVPGPLVPSYVIEQTTANVPAAIHAATTSTLPKSVGNAVGASLENKALAPPATKTTPASNSELEPQKRSIQVAILIAVFSLTLQLSHPVIGGRVSDPTRPLDPHTLITDSTPTQLTIVATSVALTSWLLAHGILASLGISGLLYVILGPFQWIVAIASAAVGVYFIASGQK